MVADHGHQQHDADENPEVTTTRRPAMAAPGLNAAALLIYTAFVVYQTLADGGTWACGDVAFEVPRRLSRSDVLANVVAYIPLGWLFAVTVSRAGRRPAVRLGVGLASALAVSGLSLALELVQSCQSARVSSASDWAANTVGGSLGVLAAAALPLLAYALEPSRVLNGVGQASDEARLRLATLAIVVLWVLSESMPWVFAVDLGTLRRHLAFLRHSDADAAWNAWAVLRHGGAWVAVAAACRLAWQSRAMAALSLLAASAASVLLQMMLVARAPLSYEEVSAMGAVVVVFLASLALVPPPTLARWWPRWLLAGLVAVIAAYELQPATGPTHVFSWIPLVGFGNRRGALDFAWLFGWAGWGTVVAARWAERHRDGWHARRWPLALVGLVLLLEVLQTQIPGRGPDTSAIFFVGLAVLATRVVLRKDN